MLSLLVLKHALQQIAAHADIQCMASARHNVCAVDPLIHDQQIYSMPIDECNPPAIAPATYRFG